MANRVLRDWTTSEKIDLLSEGGELFFVRLIMKADDHGCFHANPKLLKAALFPLKDYTAKQMDVWVIELEKAGIIQTYHADGRAYLRINDFGQRLRNMVSKFPQPNDNPPPIDSNPPPETKRNEVERKWKTAKEAFEEIKLDEQQIEQYQRQLHFKGFKSATNTNVLAALRHFLNKQVNGYFLDKSKTDVRSHFSNWLDCQKHETIQTLTKNA
jgi:hypothetical protein